jgi:hypothetical protein
MRHAATLERVATLRFAALRLAALLATVAAARGAAAQSVVPRLDATVGRPGAAPAAPSLGTAAPLLTPGVRVETPRLALAADADLLVGGGAGLGGARVALLGASPAWRSLRATVTAAGARDVSVGRRAALRGVASAAVALELGRGGLWAGYDFARFTSAGSSTGGTATPARDTTGRVPGNTGRVPAAPGRDWRDAGRVSLGAWGSAGALLTSVVVRGASAYVPGRASTLRPYFRDNYDTNRVTRVVEHSRTYGYTGDPGVPGGERPVGDVDARVAWGRGRLALAGGVGVSLLAWRVDSARLAARGPRGSWASLDAVLRLGGPAALVIGVARRWHDDDVAAALAAGDAAFARGARTASVGLRLSPEVFARPALAPVARPAAAAFALRPAGPGRWALRVRVASARAVELSGELTAWQPVAMRRVDADTWETVVAARPGSYRLSVRVDGGAWTAPPGLAAVDDDFGGSAGIVVVP